MSNSFVHPKAAHVHRQSASFLPLINGGSFCMSPPRYFQQFILGSWGHRPAAEGSLLSLFQSSSQLTSQHLIRTTGGREKGAGAWDNTKALWKQPDHQQLLPRLLGNQSLLFYCWMLEGVQLVQPFSYGRYTWRHQSVMGCGIPVTRSKRLSSACCLTISAQF